MPSRKFKTSKQKEQFKQLVLESIIQRLTIEETQNYIKSKMNIDVSVEWISKTKAKLKQEAKDILLFLKKDKHAYNILFWENIEEIRLYQKHLWKIYHNNIKRPEIQLRCIYELKQNTILLSNFHELLPLIVGGFAHSLFTDEDDNPKYEKEKSNRFKRVDEIYNNKIKNAVF